VSNMLCSFCIGSFRDMVSRFWRHLGKPSDGNGGLEIPGTFWIVVDRDRFISARRPENWRSKRLASVPKGGQILNSRGTAMMLGSSGHASQRLIYEDCYTLSHFVTPCHIQRMENKFVNFTTLFYGATI
jgi:hypothetical protein